MAEYIEPGAVILGFVVSILVAVSGVGGGSLLTPALILGLGIPPQVAIGTDLLYSCLTRGAALCIYARRGDLRWSIIKAMLTGSIPGAVLALAIIWLLRSDAAHLSAIFSGALGFALCLSGLAILLRERRRGPAGAAADKFPRERVIAIGAAVGLLVGLSSLGAGAIGMAALVAVFPAIEMRQLVGTDIAHGLVLGAVAGAGHFFIGRVDLLLLANLLLGMLPGILLAGRLTTIVPDSHLRRVVAVALIVTAFKIATG